MAHFAQVDDDGVVRQVIVVADADAGVWPGLAGEQFCAALLGGRWKQTSYNTRGGVHYDPVTNQPDGGVPRRMNYAVIGGTYDAARDAFIPPNPGAGAVLNPDTCLWEEPWQP